MRVLITGAAGQLGQDIQKLLNKKGVEFIATDYTTFGAFPHITPLDITNLTLLRNFLREKRVDVIINCAAYNAVDKAEEDWKTAYQVNGVGVRNLAVVSEELGAFLVHFSTDYVFDGEKGIPYTIYDEPNPISKYGESKYLGEKLLARFSRHYALIRTSWVFGTGNINFAKKVIMWSKEKEVLKIVTDEVSAPTYTVDLAEATWRIIKLHACGLYHVTNSGQCSRYEYAKYILERIGWKGQILPVKQEDFNLPAKRPKFSVLDNFGFKETVNWEMPDWKDAVDRFLKEEGYFE